MWLENGLPSNKLILGVPTYARCFNLLENDNHGIGAPVDQTTCGGQWTDEDGFLSFYEVTNAVFVPNGNPVLHPGFLIGPGISKYWHLPGI